MGLQLRVMNTLCVQVSYNKHWSGKLVDNSKDLFFSLFYVWVEAYLFIACLNSCYEVKKTLNVARLYEEYTSTATTKN